MSKRNNITYVKPQEPSFLAKLKAEIGYKEGPNVDTKRQKLDEAYDSDTEERPEREDEQPQIVVLQRGDLTAEEVAVEQQRIAKEETEKPADLSQPIVFKQRIKPTAIEADLTKAKKSDKQKKHSKSKASSSSKLSFNEDEEDEDAATE